MKRGDESVAYMRTGVTDFKVSGSDLASTYKKGAAPGCQTAACGRYANQVLFA